MLDRRMELTAMRSDDSEFPVELAITVVDSDPPIFTGYLRDISEEKAAERALRDSRERMAFLAEASALLSSSLNYRTVLERLANLVVPSVADWCAVDVLEEDGTLRRVAVAHADPAKRDVARQLVGIRPDEEDGHVLREVLATGEAVIAPDGFDACGGNTKDPDRRRVIEELGCRSALVVPLVARGRTLGAMTLVAVSGDRSYGSAELSLAEDLARRAALAVDNARLYRERSHVARTLQRSLLPPHLPQIPGLDIAARYHAAGEGNEVGGDFYDLFRTGKDDWGIVIGDVCGKGADAAALTALARYTIRAGAMQARKPSRILGILNEALLSEAATRDLMDQRFCTVAYTRLRPAEDGVRITSTSGGHPVPLVLRTDGSIEPACRVGTLIGVLPEPSLADRSTVLRPGDVLVLYTDGIIEARGPEGVFGEERVHALIAGCAGLDASTIAERIERTVLDFQLGEPRDDIALMIMRVASAAAVAERTG
jgi:serine phosphatase RsbU (regulator of sigma subunit)